MSNEKNKPVVQPKGRTATKNATPSYVDQINNMNFATVSGVPLWVVDESQPIMTMPCTVTLSKKGNLYLAAPSAVQHKVAMIHTGSFYESITEEQLYDEGAVLQSRVQAYKPADIDESVVLENYADNQKAVTNWQKAIDGDFRRLYLVDFTEV